MQIVRYLLGTLLVLLLVGVPLGYSAFRQTQIRNFRIVEPGVLYRSGAIHPTILQKVIDQYQIRTIISFRSLRRPGDAEPEIEEELYCQSVGIKYVRIPYRGWKVESPGQPPVGQASVDEFLNVVSDPKNHPILMHCFAGNHRTGVFGAIYRMEKHRWSNESAIEEMRRLGYVNIDKEEDVQSYLQNYLPTWKQSKN